VHCHRNCSSKRFMKNLLQGALDEAGTGGRATDYTKGFSTLSTLPNVTSTPGSLSPRWYSVKNTHGGTTTSFQYDLGTSGYSVKVYFNDHHHNELNTVAIVETDYIGHALDALSTGSGWDNDDNRNYTLAIGYLNSIGMCE
jgi:hypothetical protein